MYMTEYTNKIYCVCVYMYIYIYIYICPHIKHTFIEKFLDRYKNLVVVLRIFMETNKKFTLYSLVW